jgi:hypothetical protein
VLLQLLLPALLTSIALNLPWLLAVWWLDTDTLLLHLLLSSLATAAAVRLDCRSATVTPPLHE